jgi:hypothetical protein
MANAHHKRQRTILHTIDGIEQTAPNLYVLDTSIAETLGLSLQAVRDHLDILEQEGKIVSAHSHEHYQAKLTARGRMELGEPESDGGRTAPPSDTHRIPAGSHSTKIRALRDKNYTQVARHPIAFMSYASNDDKHDGGNLTRFRERLSGEVQAQTGKEFVIFQDRKDILWGQYWKERIDESLDAVTFFIPIITPSFFNSAYCREELQRFLERERTLNRRDLILPVYYIGCPLLEDEVKRATDQMVQVIAARQYADWRGLRHKSQISREARETISELARHIRDALERSEDTEHLDQHVPSALYSTSALEAVDRSTVFFDKRFCAAFPGVRGVEWFAGKDAITRLSVLLQDPLSFETGKRGRNPIWYWRDMNYPINTFRILNRFTILAGTMELRIRNIAAVNIGAYNQCFVYIETDPMKPTGLYPRRQEEVETIRKRYGYSWEEYGLYKGKRKITKDQYDDNGATIRGKLYHFGQDVEFRVRYITPFNIILAAHGSPINNHDFDKRLTELMNGLLVGKFQFETLVEEIARLPLGPGL